MTFDKQSNGRRTAVESKPNRSCNRRITETKKKTDAHEKSAQIPRRLYGLAIRGRFDAAGVDFTVINV